MSHAQEQGWMIYYDAPRRLVDALPDPGEGAIGSNWQIAESQERAEAFVEEMLARGWCRGHNWAPRF